MQDSSFRTKKQQQNDYVNVVKIKKKLIILVNFQLKKTVDELNNAMEAKEELMQRCHELDLQVFQLVLINVFTLVVHPPS